MALIVGKASMKARLPSLMGFSYSDHKKPARPARHIMAAAAANLVIITLELGGNIPVVITRSADANEAVQRIMVGKMLNAGQVCIAPDYVMVPEETLSKQSRKCIFGQQGIYLHGQCPPLRPDIGQYFVTINPADEDFTDNPTRKIAPTLIINPDDDAMCMQDEIFGPILPIKTYKNFEETISLNIRALWRLTFSVKTKRKKNAFWKAQLRAVCRLMMCSTCCPFGGIKADGLITGLKGQNLQPRKKSPNPFAKLAGFNLRP